MRVGILTYHHTTNYGATMQCLGVCDAVRMLGHEPEVIDYRHPAAQKYYLRNNLRTRSAPRNVLKWLSMRDFVGQHLPLSKRVKSGSDMSMLCKQRGYGAVIAGSDQVWDQKPKSIRGWAPEYLLDFVPDDIRKVAYAPSAGSMTSFESHAAEAARLLKRFHALSARDKNTLQLIEQTSGRSDAAYVLDPTFLPDFSKYAKAASRSKPYLLLYAEVPASLTRCVESVADSLGLEIVNIGYRFAGRSSPHIGASPAEWLGYFSKASFVITSFFHGTIFSILNRRPFITLRQSIRSIKVTDLLTRLGLEDRALDITLEGDELKKRSEALLTLDYTKPEAAIASSRDLSMRYLADALSG